MGLTWTADSVGSQEKTSEGWRIGDAFYRRAELWLHNPPDGWVEAVAEAVGKPFCVSTVSDHHYAVWNTDSRKAARDLLSRAHDVVEALRQRPEPAPPPRPTTPMVPRAFVVDTEARALHTLLTVAGCTDLIATDDWPEPPAALLDAVPPALARLEEVVRGYEHPEEGRMVRLLSSSIRAHAHSLRMQMRMAGGAA